MYDDGNATDIVINDPKTINLKFYIEDGQLKIIFAVIILNILLMLLTEALHLIYHLSRLNIVENLLNIDL